MHAHTHRHTPTHTHTHTHIYIYIYITAYIHIDIQSAQSGEIRIHRRYELQTKTNPQKICLLAMILNCMKLKFSELWRVLSYLIIITIISNSKGNTLWVKYVCLKIFSIKNSLSSSWCRAASTDLSDPLSPPVSIVSCSPEVFKAIYNRAVVNRF